MSSSSLPDELIAEILSPALSIADVDFASTASISPFASYAESTSTYLLVCKTWLRVATPILYNVVVIRSKAQAAALAVVLSQTEHDLGRYVKKLRIEGAYGPAVQTVLQHMPNVAHLFISFDFHTTDNPVGLCRGLPLINPTRLIVHDNYIGRTNKMKKQLLDAFDECIPKWDKLHILDVSGYQSTHWPYNATLDRLFVPFAASRQLKTIVVAHPFFVDKIYEALKGCPLSTFRVSRKRSDWPSKALTSVISNPKAESLTQFVEDEEFNLTPAASLSSSESSESIVLPLVPAHLTVPSAVLRRILYFAMCVPELESESPPPHLPSRFPFLLVSKDFLHLALEFYYVCVVLKTAKHASNIRHVISTYPSLCAQIRVLIIFWRPYTYSSSSTQRFCDARYVKTISWIVERLPALTKLTSEAAELPWKVFTTIASTCGATLRELTIKLEKAKHPVDPTPLYQLVRCRKLRWDSQAELDEEAPAFDAAPFADLEELQILSADVSFVDHMSAFPLPSLSCATLKGDGGDESIYSDFLKLHGAKLRELELAIEELVALPRNIFTRCPRLESLCVSWPKRYDGSTDTNNPIPSKIFCPRSPHGSLKKLRFQVYFGAKIKRTHPDAPDASFRPD
ncbi:Isocitrate dehydrogenase [Mycena chlorophos]|uniref:Isocitrate dehydrogenase n=1 Tax=Mycena chlorophos TaxID=658473 RepID=A0A8H6VVU2_MYCCL|nr:Isocitrate dehydrogenase [Mycena chlorophos]